MASVAAGLFKCFFPPAAGPELFKISNMVNGRKPWGAACCRTPGTTSRPYKPSQGALTDGEGAALDVKGVVDAALAPLPGQHLVGAHPMLAVGLFGGDGVGLGQR